MSLVLHIDTQVAVPSFNTNLSLFPHNPSIETSQLLCPAAAVKQRCSIFKSFRHSQFPFRYRDNALISE